MNADAERVLKALLQAEHSGRGEALPLRQIATATLEGDRERAGKVLAQLDMDGLVRTDVMGWFSGRLTERGRARACQLSEAQKPDAQPSQATSNSERMTRNGGS